MKKKVTARVLIIAATLFMGCTRLVYAQVSGFQGTVNNYDVGMNPTGDCQHPSNEHPACSQWFHFKFQAFADGMVQAPIRITNDSLNGYCGRVKLIVKDHAGGTVLRTFISGRYYIDSKGSDTEYHERTVSMDWTFKADPAVGQRGGDLYGVGMNEEYQDLGLNSPKLFPDAVNKFIQTAEAIVCCARSTGVESEPLPA
jgi:hypothetical protein